MKYTQTQVTQPWGKFYLSDAMAENSGCICWTTTQHSRVQLHGIKKECLAILYAMKLFQPYLYGTKFLAFSDHQALSWLFSLKDTTGRSARWAILLQQYNFEIKYKKGTQNGHEDGLSRREYPVTQDQETLSPERMEDSTTEQAELQPTPTIVTLLTPPAPPLLVSTMADNSAPGSAEGDNIENTLQL